MKFDPQNPPTYDQVASLLAPITETFSYKDFRSLLHDRERLKAWLLKEMPKQPEESDEFADQEQKIMELMNDLNPEDRAQLRAMFEELWGKTGKGMIPGVD